MSWYHDLRQKIANHEIALLLRMPVPRSIFRIYGEYAIESLIQVLKQSKIRVSLLRDGTIYDPRIIASDMLVGMGKAALPALLDALKDDSTSLGGLAFTFAKIAEKTDIDLRLVQKALKEYVESVERKGDVNETIRVQKVAARFYILISRVEAKFRASSQTGMEGVMLEGTVKTPSREKGTYRAAARRAFA